MLQVEMKNDVATLENSLAFSYEVNIHVPYDSVFPLLGIYPRKIKHVHTQFVLRNVHSSLIHNNTKWETTRIFCQLVNRFLKIMPPYGHITSI